MSRSLGKMSVYKLFNWRDSAANTILETVQAFLELGEAVATRWIQTRKGVMLLQMVPDNNASGAIYVFDRQRDDWYMLSFEGCEDRFTSETLRPGLLRIQVVQLRRATRPAAFPSCSWQSPNRPTLPHTTHPTNPNHNLEESHAPIRWPYSLARNPLRTGRGRRLSRPPHRTQHLRHQPQTRAGLQARPAALRPPVLKEPNLVAALKAGVSHRAFIFPHPQTALQPERYRFDRVLEPGYKHRTPGRSEIHVYDLLCEPRDGRPVHQALRQPARLRNAGCPSVAHGSVPYYLARDWQTKKPKPLDADAVRMHLNGDITINLYAINPETQRSKWVAIDADFDGAIEASSNCIGN